MYINGDSASALRLSKQKVSFPSFPIEISVTIKMKNIKLSLLAVTLEEYLF